MRKYDVGDIIMGAVLIAGSAFLFGTVAGYNKAERELYPLTTVVTEVNRISDTVTCLDTNGHEWKFEGCEDWAENDICTLLMESNSTKMIYDDSIIQTRYQGSVESYLDMETVTDYDASETGLMMYTADGSGYYWER